MNSVNEAAVTDTMFDFCIAELKHKAEHVYGDVNTPIVVYNADVVKSRAQLGKARTAGGSEGPGRRVRPPEGLASQFE